MSDRLADLSEKLSAAADARAMTTSPVWARAWEGFERELLERLLECGPEDDVLRYRRQIAIEVARRVRRTLENQGLSVASLEKELALIDGRLMRPIA